MPIKAIILIGGYGTRLRPLTFSCPKPIFPFVNKTPIQGIVQALSLINVNQIILGFDCQCNQRISEQEFAKKSQVQGEVEPINQQASMIMKELKPLQQKYKVKFVWSQKHQALGTAGPIKYAEKQLKQNNQEGMFFVFNSDVICNYPLKELLEYHRLSGQEASILLATVKDPSRFGVVVRDQTSGKVHRFVQKPKQFVGNSINAGIYILNCSVIDRIPSRFCMIQMEVFPYLALEGKLHSLLIKDNFWYDIGKPEDYINAQGAYLEYYKPSLDSQYKNKKVLIDQTSQVGIDCKIGPNVVIGPNCKIGNGVRLRDCTLIANVTIENYAYVSDTIVSWDCSIRSYARIQGLSCLAEDVEVREGVRVTKCLVCSHKSISSNVQNQVLM